MAVTKRCPYCAETIQAAAVVCRYCHLDLRTGRPVGESQQDQQQEPPQRQKRQQHRSLRLSQGQSTSSTTSGVFWGLFHFFITLPVGIVVACTVCVAAQDSSGAPSGGGSASYVGGGAPDAAASEVLYRSVLQPHYSQWDARSAIPGDAAGHSRSQLNTRHDDALGR